jgi:hypothetical protein
MNLPVKARPILFNPAMVQAERDGRKTQTRRCVVPRHKGVYVEQDRCPYGAPGDQLWVREQYYQRGHWEPVEGVKTKTGLQKWKFIPESDEVIFEAPESFRTRRDKLSPESATWHRRLGRFMPRRYSRTLLEVVSVRVERIQDISEEDARAEGVSCWVCGNPSIATSQESCCYGGQNARDSLAVLWDSINGDKPGRAWADNPCVWVVEFRRVEAHR